MDIPETNKNPAEPNSTDLDESFSFTESLSQDKTFSGSYTLAETFGLTKFKPFQKEIIKATLDGKDTIVIHPTGSGKSLCFQFPPVYQQKKAIVISPTISLMQDQATNLTSKGIKATYLGSAQINKKVEVEAFTPHNEDRVIFVTPEWISKDENKAKVQRLVDADMLSVIAIDEAHLFYQWQEFRHAYKELETLKFQLILTATAPPSVESSMHQLVRSPVISKTSINRPNIFLQCEEIPSDEDSLSIFATRVSQIIQDECSIIYTDFINDIGPIMSKLEEQGISSVAYYGELDAKSRYESYMKWKTDEVKVMVATSAFGMGINKHDIRHIVRYGVPENLCTWAQELGRGGRDGQPATATIFYSMSNTNHAMAWLREHHSNTEHCERILKEFSVS